jgi:hypothetical protein
LVLAYAGVVRILFLSPDLATTTPFGFGGHQTCVHFTLVGPLSAAQLPQLSVAAEGTSPEATDAVVADRKASGAHDAGIRYVQGRACRIVSKELVHRHEHAGARCTFCPGISSLFLGADTPGG